MQTTGNLNSSEISLYFHIPFCTRKCHYCHFYVVPDKESDKDELLKGFLLELKQYQLLLKEKKVLSLYFGGGTPSLFGPARLSFLLAEVKKITSVSKDAEITLEANPENVTSSLIESYVEAGINRVSLGIQTLDAELLKLIGRTHNPQTAKKAVNHIFEAGIKNISIDLMYDLPKQTLEHWRNTLDQIQELPISHLSLYNLTIEPHTVFFKNQESLRPFFPNEETSLAMYEMAIQKLERFGLRQYEISAFAKPGFESLHNSGYWTGRPFLGFGPSAFSYWEEKRWRNVSHLKKYCHCLYEGKSPIDFEEKLNPDAHSRELFVIHLRLLQGVCLKTFTLLHGPLDRLILATIDRLVEERYLTNFHGTVSLTRKGILFYDSIAVDLI